MKPPRTNVRNVVNSAYFSDFVNSLVNSDFGSLKSREILTDFDLILDYFDLFI